MTAFDGTTYRLYYSSDGGGTWTEATGYTASFTNLQRPTLQFAPSDNSIVYVIGAKTAANGIVYKSTDYGHSYTALAAPNIAIKGSQTWYDNPIWIDPTNANRIVNGDVDNYQSTNGGASWTKISNWVNHYSGDDYPHADVHQVVHDPGYNGTTNKKVYFVTDGGIFRQDDITTADPGTGWHTLQYNQASMQAYGASGNTAGQIISGLQDNGTVWNDNGNTASILVAGGDGGYCASDPSDVNYQYGEYVRLQIYQTTDNWTNSFYIYSGITEAGTTSANFIAPFTLSLNNPNIMYAGGRSLWRSTNLKTTHTWSAVTPSFGQNISAVGIAPGNDDVVLIGYNPGWVIKVDNATTASNQAIGTHTILIDGNNSSNPLPDRAINRFAILDSTATNFIVALGGFSANNLQKTTDGGTSFTSISGSGVTALPSVPIRAIAVNPNDSNNIFVGTEVGIFKTDDGGATWSTSNFGPSNVCTYDLQWLSGSSTKLIAATHGRGTWLLNVAAGVRPDSLSVNKPNIAGGNKLVGTVTLNETADTGGQVVTLSSDQTISDLPASITIPAGQTVGTFNFTPPGVDTTQNYSIHATSAGVTVNAPLTITKAVIQAVGFNPSSVVGGKNSTGTVYLTGAAGPSGATVTLSSGATEVTVPASVSITAQSKSAAFTANTSTVSSVVNASVTGSLDSNSVNGSLKVNPYSITALNLSTSSVVGGNPVSAVVKLNAPAPTGGVAVTLSCPDSSVNFPTSITVPSGATVAGVTFKPDGVDSTLSTTLKATLNGVDTTKPLSVTAASLVNTLFSPSSLYGGGKSTLRLILNGAAGPSGMSVSLAPSDSALVLPGTVSVPSQAKSLNVAAITNGVDVDTNSYALVNAGAFTPGVTIMAATANSAYCVSSVLGGKKISVGIKLNGKAGPSGVAFSISSSNPHAVPPASVTVPAGASVVGFVVNTTAVSSATPVTITCHGTGTVGTVAANFTIN